MGKNRMEDEVVEEKKPYNKFQWFLIVIIPVFFTIFILLIVLTIAGVNVFQWSKEVGSNIPVVSTLFKEAKEPSLDEMNGEIVDLKGEIKNREAQIAQLESELERGAEEKEQLIEEMQALKKKSRHSTLLLKLKRISKHLRILLGLMKVCRLKKRQRLFLPLMMRMRFKFYPT